jgi:hypothetical protein
LNQEAPKPIIPSSEYRWGLINLPQKKQWLGLTEREFALLYEWVVKESLEQWYMWNLGWPDWRPLHEVEKTWECFLPEFPGDLAQPPKSKGNPA